MLAAFTLGITILFGRNNCQNFGHRRRLITLKNRIGTNAKQTPEQCLDFGKKLLMPNTSCPN